MKSPALFKPYFMLLALAFGLKGSLPAQINIKDKVKNAAGKVKENSANNNMTVNKLNDKILFASKPFSAGGTSQNSFKAGSAIYGKIVCTSLSHYVQEIDNWNMQNLKEEGVNKNFTHSLVINVSKASEPNGSNVDVRLYLTAADLDKKELYFDVSPSEADATTYYVESQTFFNILANRTGMDDYLGSTLEYVFTLKDKNNESLEHNPNQPSARLTIDYTGCDYDSQTAWRNQQEEIRTATAQKHKTGTVGMAAPAKNKILFGTKPFSKSPAPVNAVKAGTPVYGRLVLDKPLKDHASSGNVKKLCFTVLVKINGVYVDDYKQTCNVLTGPADQSTKEIDFDMAPSTADASTMFEEDREFYRLIATNAYYGEGAVADYKIVLLPEDNPGLTITGEGLLQVDYSHNDYDAAMAWYQQCLSANESVKEKAEKAGVENTMNSIASKMMFAAQPFAKNPQPQTSFKAGTPIYGKLTLEKPLKNYCRPLDKDLVEYYKADKDVVRVLEFTINIKQGEGEYEKMPIVAQLFLSEADLDKNTIEFDLTPATGESSARYAFGSAFYRSFASEWDIELGKKVNFKITIDPEMNALKSEIHDLSAAGDLTIDYTASTKQSQKTWFDQGQREEKTARTNALKKVNQLNAEKVKSMPLPLCFSKGNNAGYKDPRFSNAALTAMIKQKLGVTEVKALTFDKADGEGDFRSLVDASTDYPTCKMGNHVFYFAFKEPDGTWRFSGGVIKMDYIGNGQYGEPYIFNYSPIQDNDPAFPLDVVRDEQGHYGNFIFDGTKLK